MNKQTGLAILGSTGSIGCNTLRVLEALGDTFRVVALSAGRNMEKLSAQIERHRPEFVSVETEECAGLLREELRRRAVAVAPRIGTGEAGLVEAATHGQAACVVSATVGAVGLVPTLRALEAGKRVALANKETLVMAGELMTRAASASGAELLPIDSEHNALHQCLRGERRAEVRRLILTASGGPFRTCSSAEMEAATVAEAMRHPTWDMGAKITIDSATLMNKGLEVIEAHWLFGFDADEIDIIVHPESVVHSLVELIDGSMLAQLGVTDMRHAIQYALTYPERRPTRLAPLDLTKLSTLSFAAPDAERFPCLTHAYRALRAGGTMPTALNAANEIAVQSFLGGKLKLTDIPRVIEQVIDQHDNSSPLRDLNQVLAIDREARAQAVEAIAGIQNSICKTQSPIMVS
ncbi:MAG: 1-deoxy-D-xylulose-5-phosphate reductoisomerase [Pyrinomonadaceae bacterium]|nr:1-deoxy-D-xylulose-5-phosphate reductoisomerase [Pyrinomonadaceae bacterium]